MAARSLIATGLPFAPREGSFSDEDVALDEILSLPTPPDPLVLRVEAEGGTPAERGKVHGDWFFDTDGKPTRRVPKPRWQYRGGASTFSEGRTWLDAWEECSRADWLLFEAARAGVDLKSIVLAACDLCLDVFRAVSLEEAAPLDMVETAQKWARGKVSIQEVSASKIRARTLNTREVNAGDDALSCAQAASYDEREPCGNYAAYVAMQAGKIQGDLPPSSRVDLAGRVRRSIPPVQVLRAVMR